MPDHSSYPWTETPIGEELPEIILTYPNVDLLYHVCPKTGDDYCNCFKEIMSKEYGYRLTPGQRFDTIRYRESNYNILIYPEVVKVYQNGILVNHLLQKDGADPIFVPFQKSLPVSGKFEMRDMYISPCEDLYEKNNLSDVLAGNIATDDYDESPDHKWIKSHGAGIWYRRGEYRCKSRFSDNLANFVKIGQLDLFGLQEVPGDDRD